MFRPLNLFIFPFLVQHQRCQSYTCDWSETNKKHQHERIDPKITSPKRLNPRQKYSDAFMSYNLVTSLVQYLVKFKSKIFNFIYGATTNMSNQAVDQYLIAIIRKYQVSNKVEKGSLLDHAELITGRSRKHIIRRLNNFKFAPSNELIKPKGRPLTYSKEELIPHLKYLWTQMERISPKRMKAGLKCWLPKYKDCPAHLKMQLHKMSATTIGRYLKEVRSEDICKKGLSTTSPARYMKNKVPINTLDAKIKKPGFTQTDTVAHCGNSAAGPFISSLTVTDIFTTWTENRAMLSKKGYLIKNNFKDVEKALPFKLLAINSDSGSEFLNKNMLQYTTGRSIVFTRSRPYKKNDNCYVEQKNFTHVRELFGYERFEDQELVDLMNDIYKNYWNPLQNYFLPTFKLKEKIRIGAKIKKKYDKPKTPYQRIIESGILTKQQEDRLRMKKQDLNPFELKANLEIKLKEFFEVLRKINIRKEAA